MSKVSYIEIPSGYEDIYRKPLMPGDRFTFSRIRIKDLFLSRSRVKGVTLKSMLVKLAPDWASLSSPEKSAWITASAESLLTGWKGFVQDTTERRKAGFSGFATPSTLHQSEVGRILVESPATGLTIRQDHPQKYFVLKKVVGTRSQYSPVAVIEPFGLPLEISISWKTDLTPIDGSAKARFYCIIYSLYQGRNLETVLEIPFGMSDDWTRDTVTQTTVFGRIKGYSAFIEVHNATGNLYFDNVSIVHNSENWARDPFCNNIAQTFTKAFFQVAKHWVAVNPATGNDFGSVYLE